MAGEDWLSALLGGVEGGFAGWSSNKKREAEEERQRKIEERQAEEDAYRDEQRQFQREDREQRSRDRLRGDTESMLADIGRGGRLTPEQVEGARGVGLGHRVEDDVDFNHSIFAGAGPIPMMVPERVSEVAPTGVERRADAAARAKTDEEARRRTLEEAAINALPEHLKPAARFGSTTGKMPTLDPAEFEDPGARQRREIAGAVEREKALFPIKMREREAGKALDRRYAQMPIPTRDDPALPQGVRAYLGEIIAAYQDDPAAARGELQRRAPELMRSYPGLDLAKVTQQMNAMLPMPNLTPEEQAAAAAQRQADRATGGPAPRPPVPNRVPLPATQETPPARQQPVLPQPMTPDKAAFPIPLAQQQPPRPDARSAKASVLMQQIATLRQQGQDTTALEQQLLALKRGAGAAVVQ